MNVILFDIDGTLVSTGGAGKAAMEAALACRFGCEATSGGVTFSGRTDRAIGRDLFRLHCIDETDDHWTQFQSAYLENLPTKLRTCPGKVLPGIARLIESLLGRSDVLLGLLTGNLREGARLKLGHFMLFDHFKLGGFGDVHLCRNDVARDALAAVHLHLNGEVNPDRVWVIGDTPLDVACARAIGARSVAVATGWHTPIQLAEARPNLLLADLEDPTPLLSALA